MTVRIEMRNSVVKHLCFPETGPRTLTRHVFLIHSSSYVTASENVVDSRIVKTGFDPNTCRSNFQLDRFLKSGQFSQARQLFDHIPHKNTVSINTMISGYVKSGDVASARMLFDTMVERTAVTWTILIGGYTSNNQFRQAFELYAEMNGCGTKPDYVTFVTLLSGCSGQEDVNHVIQAHAHVVKMGFYSTLIVCNSLMDSYCKATCLSLAGRVFNEMNVKDCVTYNTMITGYANDGLNKEAIDLFVEMQTSNLKPSEFTFAAILCAGVGLSNMDFGKQVHCFVIKTNYAWNVFVANALLDFYSKHDCMVSMRKFFYEMPELDGISYNVVISGYAWDGQYKESLGLFQKLLLSGSDRKQFPFSSILSIAANTMELEMGRQIHAQTIVTTAASELQVGNSLVYMYAKCGRLEEAEIIFLNLAHRSSVPWTAMISAYVHKGCYEESLQMFNQMHQANVSADQATFASVLRASANLASMSLGKQVHSLVSRSGLMSNVICGSALLDMYAKCGSLKDAIQMFHEMPARNVVSWNALLLAYAQNGKAETTMELFEEMVQTGIWPDSVSFLSVLTACSHSGLVEKGREYFNSMTQIHKIDPRRDHYASMVDILCRNGRFDEAKKLMAQMPFDPDEIMWTSVLNSCRIHKNQELAKKAASKLFNMELRDAAAYVTMSNIYATADMWDKVVEVKKAMRMREIKKVPAYSWVEINHKIHAFSANDRSHPQTKEIRLKIDYLTMLMEKEGYQPDISCAMHNEDSEIKVESLKYHSERLAIAFSLLSTSEGSPILVMKNLRSCSDCHAAIKVISKIVKREITVRDSSRFHHFRDGLCSCGDYW